MGIPIAICKAILIAWLGVGMTWSLWQAPPARKPLYSHPPSPAGQAQLAADPAPVVYLTFDDGPHPVYTPQVLDLLARYDAKATFFVVGQMVANFPDVTRRIAAEGHSIQLHTWRHDDLTKLSRQEFIEDSNRAQAILGETVGLRATCLRPPYGSISPRVREWATDLRLGVSMWDISGADWTDISAETIARIVTGRVQPGSVVLLHDGGGHRHRTVSALGTILADLTEAGYRFGSMCRILNLPEPNPTCWEFYAWPVPRPCPEPSQADGL